MTKPKADHQSQVKHAFDIVWPVHLTGFTELLIKLRARFEGDLDQMLVLAVIGARTRPDRWSPQPTDFRSMTVGADDKDIQLPINVQSLSDYSGIPRETVRRKVAQLVSKGWVDRDSRGRLSIARAAARDLEDATLDTLDYLSAIAAALSKSGNRG